MRAGDVVGRTGAFGDGALGTVHVIGIGLPGTSVGLA